MVEQAKQTPTRRRRRAVVKSIVLGAIVVVCILVLPRVERHLLINACSIAYVADDGRLHLTNESGTVHVELDGPTVAARAGRAYAPPAWSLRGTYLAYQCLDVWDGTSHVAVINPWTGERWLHANARGARFGGWTGDETWLEGHRVRDARTGAVVSEEYDGVTPLQPFFLETASGAAIFCGAGPDGKLLANVRERAAWGLVIVDRDRKSVRPIVTEVRPMAESAAGWRTGGR